MRRPESDRRALGLLSGGLDGQLAAALLLRAGGDVEVVHFDTGFVHAERRRRVAAIASGDGPPALGALAGRVSVVDLRPAYLDLLRAPRHGFGRGLNPCLDCRALMLGRAAELARERGVELLFTGDVLGQRAMDQSHRAFEIADGVAGVAGRVLRPLSAALLPAVTGAEWTAADGPQRLHGRGRRGQAALAVELGLPFSPTPSGGCCRLAEGSTARRLRDLLERDPARPAADAVERLVVGRHLRLGWAVKVVVGRDEAENALLERGAGTRWTARVAGGRGAVVVVEARREAPSDEDLRLAAAVAARYSAERDAAAVDVELRRGEERRVVVVAPIEPRRLADGRL